MSFLYKPHILIILFSILLLNITSMSLTYIYMQKSKSLLYEQAFEYLQFITNIKKHQLSLFFESKKTNILIMSKNPTLLNFADKLYSIDTDISHKNKSIDFKNIYKDYSELNKSFKSYISNNVYADIMIVSLKNNNIMYSANDSQKIGQKICSNTPLEIIRNKVLKTKQFYIGDMNFCPIRKQAIMQMATPLIKDSKTIAILVIELPSNVINEIIRYRVGMGSSGETYAVGEDYHLRSDSYLEENFTVRNSFLEDEKLIKTQATKNVFMGKEGSSLIKDYRGVSVLSAYQIQKFSDFSWAIISEIDENEILKRVHIIKREIFIWATFISIILTLIGYFIIKKIIFYRVIAPLNKVHQKVKGFADIIANSLNEVYVFDTKSFKYDYANKVALKNIQYTYKEIKEFTPLKILSQYNNESFLILLNKLISKENHFLEFTTTQQRKDTSSYPVNVKLQIIKVDGIDKFVAIINDISEKIKAIEEKEMYYEQSTHDYLTKAYNRQKFDEIYIKEAKRAQRYGIDLCLILLDIDDFKNVNDTYGHEVGDMVLIKISELIKKHTRDSDLFARWGGEEFVILLTNTNIQMALEKAEILRKDISDEKFDNIVHVTCSFGVSRFRNGENYEQIFQQADNALYQAKRNGKNNVEYINKTI